jgi:hypothetical protein
MSEKIIEKVETIDKPDDLVLKKSPIHKLQAAGKTI